MSPVTDDERGQVLQVYGMFGTNLFGYLIRLLGWCLAVSIVLSIIYPTLRLPNDSQMSVLIMMCLLGFWWIGRRRIVVREKGIEYHGSSNDIFGRFRPHPSITWENMDRLEVIAQSDGEGGTSYSTMLYLKQPSGKSLEIERIILIPYITYTTGRWFKFRRHKEPIIDPKKLLETSFGQYLLKYAPHVIEQLKHEETRMNA